MKVTNGFSYGGYSDWRLPTINELKSLVYCSSGKPKIWNDTEKPCEGGYIIPTINQIAFPQKEMYGYWSSSPVVGHDNYEWIVSFDTGDNSWDDENGYGNYVRFVRSGR